MGAGAEALGLPSVAFQGLEVRQLGHEPVPIWDARAAGGDLTCNATVPTL